MGRWVTVVAFTLAGCASAQPQFPDLISEPETEQARCNTVAWKATDQGHGRVEAIRLRFVSCMIAAGAKQYVPIERGGGVGQLWVRALQKQEQERIEQDLTACSTETKGVAGGYSQWAYLSAGRRPLAERFAACLRPKGYDATLWE